MDLITRALMRIHPQWAVSRMRALAIADTYQRHYEGASKTRRTQGWKTPGSDANAAMQPAAKVLRDRARDLERNNPFASRVSTIHANAIVGWGIKPTPQNAGPRALKDAARVWQLHFETTACDWEGLHDIYGLMKLAARTISTSGSVLVRRRRLPSSARLTIPIQLQVLEPDFLDYSKDNLRTPDGGKIVRGVQFGPTGKRQGYWMFEEHPGSSIYQARGTSLSKFVPADDILHVFEVMRPGQVDGVTWFAPVLVKFRDFDELDDAKLLQQKIAACIAAFVIDPSGAGTKIGGADPQGNDNVEMFEPGMIMKLPLGRDIKFATPPSAADYDPYSKNQLRALAKGCRVTYEQFTGDYSQVNFASGKLGRLEFNADVHNWRWHMMIPMFCQGVWKWGMEAAVVAGEVGETPGALWTPPPVEILDPEAEYKAGAYAIRTGQQNLYERLRELGHDPEQFLQEVALGNKKLDELGIILDSDPRKTTQVGGPRDQVKDPGNKPENKGKPASTSNV
jgi:lambda family phage portal protein